MRARSAIEVLDLKDRAMTSAPERVDSFEQVLNDFKASYFAGALLINRERLLRTSKNSLRWRGGSLHAFANFSIRYEVTPEIFMYRLTEVLPQYLGIKLHFLRFNHEADEYRLVKHLNMSQVLIPGGTGWTSTIAAAGSRFAFSISGARSASRRPSEPIVGAQLSRFVDTTSDTCALPWPGGYVLSGGDLFGLAWLPMRREFERIVRFANDPLITRLDIDGTCERCRLQRESARKGRRRLICSNFSERGSKSNKS